MLVYALLVSVYVGPSHCASLSLVCFSLCRTVSLCWFQSVLDSLTVLVYSLLVSVYIGQSHCVSFSLCRTVCVGLCTVLVYALLVSVYVGTVSLC